MLSTLASILILLTLGYFVYCCLREIGWWLGSRLQMPRFALNLPRLSPIRREIMR
jgi:hypothetical protein